MMVEPRRGCYSLPTVDLRKKAVGGVLSVTVVSASKLGRNNGFIRETSTSSGNIMENGGNKILQTFIEVELGDLTRRTSISQGSSPKWNATFNMVLHGESGILKFNLYEWDPSSVKYNYLTSCEIKMKYVLDDSTTFWAIGPNFGVLAKQAEYCGKEVEMVVPFEETNVGELTVKLVLKEWQYSDDSTSLNKASSRTQNSVYNSQHIQLKTGRKLKVTVVEGRSLMAKDKSGRCDPYVKVQYGKLMHKTKTLSHTTNPVWHHKFDFDEIGGEECLMIKCYNADIFGDENIGSARVNLDGLVEGSCKDVWIPLEKVNSGELRLQIEALNNEDFEVSRTTVSQFGSGWIELVLIEARDLIAADLRGTSDPYVRVQYGNTKKRTKVSQNPKVVHKTLNPQWNQILEFPDTGKQLVLHVKDHNALLPTSSIGDCVVEYEWLPPNQTADKWIPLQGVKSGEIHVKVTRKVPELQKNTSLDTDISKSLSKANKISGQVRELLKKLNGLIEDGDYQNLSLALSEVENIEDGQVEYMLQLEKEKTLLLDKIGELGREISQTSSTPSKMPY